MLLGQLGASTCVYTPPSTSTECTLSCTTQLWMACHPDKGKTPFHSWRDCRSYCSFFKVRNLRGYYQIGIKLCTSLNYEILTSCQQFMCHKYSPAQWWDTYGLTWHCCAFSFQEVVLAQPPSKPARRKLRTEAQGLETPELSPTINVTSSLPAVKPHLPVQK